MSGIVSTYRKLLELPLSVLVKIILFPLNPSKSLNSISINLFFMFYLIPLKLTSWIFRRNCLSVGLPDPAEKNVIDGVALPRYVYLDEGRRF